MKILIPIDGSSFSTNSLDFVASRTTLTGDKPEIRLLVVLRALPSRVSNLAIGAALDGYYEDEAASLLQPAVNRLAEAGIAAQSTYLIGDPAEKIAEETVRFDPDLIIMGSRGRTALQGLFLGSVTNGVLARTKHPILILRNKPAPDQDALRIGVAVDGSPYGASAVHFLVHNRSLLGQDARVDLIHVCADLNATTMPTIGLSALSADEIAELQHQQFVQATHPVRALFAKAGIAPFDAPLQGDPGDAIARYAKEKDLDLIVMGSHGYGRFKSAVMGSTAMRIAAQGNTPILLIRH